MAIQKFGFAFLGLLTGWACASSNLRETVAEWASRGALDSAQVWVSQQLDSSENPRDTRLILGQLTLQGSQAAQVWQPLKSEAKSSPEQAQALYLLGQFQYAAGRYHLAIPEFREYLTRYPKGEDADRAGYWMANACLHLALSQKQREAYLDSGLAYLRKMPAKESPGSYYAALAAECQTRILLAKNAGKSADSLISVALTSAPPEEKPAFLLLKAQIMRTLGKPSDLWKDSLLELYPTSPEAQTIRRWKGKIPYPIAIPASQPIAIPEENAPTKTEPMVPTCVLQVGSYAQRENAQNQVDLLKRQGFEARLVSSQRGHQTLWQVMVGEFKSSDAAEAFGMARLQPNQILYQSRCNNP